MPNFKSFDFTDRSNESNNASSCDLRLRWKPVAIFVGILLLLLCVFFGGFYAGTASATRRINSEDEPEVEERTELPTSAPAREIDWDGVCPRRNGTCPDSYTGLPLLLLISLDGFRPDYLERGFTPTLSNLSQCGTRAPFMYPVFPSKTFPNHFSQVTGLHPASHGIVDNNMYDPSNRKVFKVGTSESLKPYWWKAEPIWVTVQKEGKKSGCFFWPGSEVKINSTLPTYYRNYSSKIRFEERVRTIFQWIDKPSKDRPSFYTLYVNQPDHAAHANGTKSDSVNVQLKRVDDMITMLFAGLQERNLLDCINVIVVSDHGMADTSCDRMIYLNNYLNISEVHTVVGAFGRIRPKGRKNETAEQSMLETLQCASENMRAYKKENLPVRYHYAYSPRVEPLFLDIDSGWMLSNYKTDENSPFCSGGNHGYDNWFPEMRAFFMAVGPSFKSNHTVEPFMNIELYELMAELVNITARPNNGTKGSLHHLLHKPEVLPPQPTYSPPHILKLPSDRLSIEMNVRDANCSRSQVVDALNMTDSDMNEFRSHHLPFGIPHRHFDSETLYLLYQPDYVSAFDVKYKLPLWTAYTISNKVNFSEEEPEWIADARISYQDSMKCSFYKDPKVVGNSILQRPLFPPSFAEEDGVEAASVVTNSVPKTQDFVTHFEKLFHDMLSEWAEQEGSINVITGPAFDCLSTNVYPGIGYIMQSHDKYGPLVVPTHYYAVVTWCRKESVNVSYCEPSDIDVASFLLPNDPVPDSCESSKAKIIKNAVRVADIEILTGISFFTELPVYDAIRLRTAVPQRQLES